ncbi:MAG: NfeD family protein [Candidatus Latescibacterota bacterium]
MNALLSLATLALLFLSPPVSADYLIVPIEGTIDGGLAEFVDRNIREAEEMNAEGIIFRMDTPGGRIDSAVHIKDAILNAKTPTIAFVDKSAISAGALISLAADSIYMSPGSSIGAATAVDLEGKKASEKVISYMRAQMRSTAEAKGRRPDLAEAMVDEDIAIPGMTEKGKLLTLTYTEALRLGISDATAAGIPEVLSLLGDPDAATVTAEINWAERVVRFLTDPVVASMLMSLAFLGLIIELKTPGFGLGGAIAIISLVLFFGSHYIVNLAGIGELLLLAAGIILVMLEIFIFPGFGFAGLAGIVLVVLGLFFSLIGNMPRREDFTAALHTLGWTFVFTVALGALLIRLLPRSKLFSRISMSMALKPGGGYASTDSAASALLGKRGVALSDLHPAGKAEIEGLRIDVVTEGGYIMKGTPVVVSEVYGARVVVKGEE